MNESANKVIRIYKGLTYSDQYGTSIAITIFFVITLFVVYSYFKTKINAQPIRDNWAKNRCRPEVLPFAGSLNAPEGESQLEYTQRNFNFCIQELVKPIAKTAVNPIDYLMAGIMKIFTIIDKIIVFIRKMISKIRDSLMAIIRDIWQRILKFLIPIQEIMIRQMDMFQKSIAIMKIALETMMGGYITLKSGMGVMVTNAAWGLIIGAIVLVILYGMFIAAILFFPWTLGFILFAIAIITAVYITVMVLIVIIINFMDNVMEIRPNLEVAPPPKKPPPPSCFDPDTEIKLENGTIKNIKDIQIGDILEDGGIVTATIKLSSQNQDMFIVNGVVVSGGHSIKHNNKLVKIKDYSEAKPLTENYSNLYIYNLNTTTKEIPINGMIFCDWDEITPEVETKLWNALSKVSSLKVVRQDVKKYTSSKRKDKSFIHKYFDGGFSKNSSVKMFGNRCKGISTIKIGDRTANGGVVYGIVKIDKYGVSSLNNSDSSLLSDSLENPEDTGVLYHLLISGNNSEFEVNGISVPDYNNYIDSVIL